MNRRGFLLNGLAATAVIGSPALAQARFLNGELNYAMGTFDWTNGGGDPLQRSWHSDGFRRALAIPRLNLDAATQAGLRQTLLQPAFERVNLAQLYEGKVVGDVMVSGNGWIALKPRLVTRSWKRGRSTMGSWWSWTNRVNGERWQIIVPDVCTNLVLTRLGQAVPCVCEPQKDACILT